MTTIDVSVIIPVYNGEKHIKKCLTALKKSSYQPIEIIVVDDGSTDNTVAQAKKVGAIVYHTTKTSGPGVARNLGARHAKGNILLFVDSDVLVKNNTVEIVKNTFSDNHEVAALFGSYDDTPQEKNFISQYRNLFHYYHHQQSDMNASTFWGGCGAIRKEIFEEMNGFDEKRYIKPSIEDIELGYRLCKKGYRIHLIKNLQVTHLKRWNIYSMLRTDILQRAIPWSRLIIETRCMPEDLNLHLSHKLSSIAVALLILSIPFLFSNYQKPFVLLSLILFFILLVLNRKLYAFFAKKRGIWFMVRVIPCHILYYLYSGASFVLCWVMNKIPSCAIKSKCETS